MALLFFFRRSGPVADSEADAFHALGSHSSDFPLWIVEVAFATAPTAADQTWTDVSDYVRALSIRRGRDHELQRAEAGTMSVVLDNRDRRFDPTYTDGPYYGTVLPMRQIRVRAYWDGVVYDLYRGFVEQWPQAWPEYGKDAVVEVTAFDALGALQLAKTIRSYRDLIIGHEPAGYWRLGEPDGATATDASGNSNHGAYVYSQNFGTLSLAEDGALNGDADTAIRTTGIDTWAVLVPTSTSLNVGTTFTVEGWVYIAGTSEGYIAGNDSTWRLKATGGGKLEFVTSDPATDTVAKDSTVNITAGTWTHVAATVSGTTIVLYVNGVDVTNAVNLANPDGDGLTLGILRMSGGTGFTVDEVAIYDSVLTAAQVAQHYYSGAGTRPAESAATRMGHYLDVAGWPSGLRDLDTGQTTLTAVSVADATANDAVQSIAEGERGLVFANPGGTVVFQDRHWRVLNASTAGAVIGDGGGTELPVADIVAGYDVQDVWNHIVVTPQAGTAVTASDASSQAAYYRRSLELSLLTTDQNEAQDAADYMLARYKDPHLRVSNVTFVGGSGTAIWPHILGGDISSRWTVNRRPPAGGTITADVHLEAIQHDIQPGGIWQTSWSLSPADPQQYWVLEDAVLGVLDSTTRLAY